MAESLVALRDRREQVILRLSECYATDVLDVDELERRLDGAHGAHTVAELDALVADLAPPAPASTALVPVQRSLAVHDPHRLEHKKQRVWLSAVEKRGAWSVPRHLDLGVFWGSAELDFRGASLAPGITTIEVSVTMGNLEVILPPDLAVDVDVSSLAASVEERHRVPPQHDPERPLLRITGKVRFGNLEISTRLSGESDRAARRRERRERKQLRGMQKALPSGEHEPDKRRS
ncbi:MAG: DUF1707 and DUF2154 domain-containing protein [Deltaproteobacteria bacterium]|nr:DUF1707 and DUF2154 domain-containing protein [Deltaproteobacteria bacterium]